MREIRTYGSVRGGLSNERPYRNPRTKAGFAALRAAEHTGRPLGTQDFIAGLERILGRRIARRAPGRKPTKLPEEQQSLF
jgi:hypothetical protein